MSIRLEAANSERLTRVGIFSGDPAFTISGWFYLHSAPAAGTYAPLVTLYNAGFVGCGIWVDENRKLVIRDYTGDNYSLPGATTLALNTWYYLHARKPTAGLDELFVYLDGSTTFDVKRFVNNSSGAMTLQLGTNQVGYGTTYYADVSLVNWKLWTGDVAAAQAAVEMDDFAVTNTTNSLAAWPLDAFADLSDDVGTDEAFTATGTLSDGPANPFGATPPTAGFSVSANRKSPVITDTSSAGTNPITSVEYAVDDEEGERYTEAELEALELSPGTHTIYQFVNDGVTAEQSTTHDVTTQTAYRWRAQTVGGRSALSNILELDDA